ncbi:MAG: flagellar M-ring protein FliF, partial [Eubacteriales bacterium]|nr:flagellar M-ring protein FliF [Eubacteriales bacterium]
MKKFILIGAIVVVIGALVFSVLINTKDYVVIFDDLSETEANEILTVLQGMDVSVKIDGGDSIMVPAESEAEVRMALATQGYPKSGLSYYLIEENSGMLTTDYEKKQYANMQLQERIAASIGTLEGVKEAVVTITAPSEKVFYLQETEEATASVVIHMKDGYALS